MRTQTDLSLIPKSVCVVSDVEVTFTLTFLLVLQVTFCRMKYLYLYVERLRITQFLVTVLFFGGFWSTIVQLLLTVDCAEEVVDVWPIDFSDM